MRRLIRWGIVLAVIWCGWWALASYGARTGVERLLAEKATDGWRAEVSQSGFPFRIRTELRDIHLPNREEQFEVVLDTAQISAPAHWPGYVTLDLPDTPITLQTPVSDIVFEGAGSQAELHLSPGTALTLETLRAGSGDWLVRIGDGLVAEAQSLDLRATRDPDDPLSYGIVFTTEDFTPGPLLRNLIRLPDDWPRSFDSFEADAAVTFDRALDRFAAEGAPPRPRLVELRDVDIAWGPVTLKALGQVRLSETGMPDGAVEVQLAQWPRLLDLLERSGALPPAMRTQSEVMLRALGNLAGDPEDIDLTLTFDKGRMALGPIDLGPAPELYLQ